MMHPAKNPAQYLARAVVLRAVKDMRGQGAKNTTAPTNKEHLDAIVWLGAAHAAKWFDVAAVDRYEVLKVFASLEASRSQGF